MKFKHIFEKMNSRDSNSLQINMTGPASRAGSSYRSNDKWCQLERAIQRGQVDEVLKWRKDHERDAEIGEEPEDVEDGVATTPSINLNNKVSMDEMLVPRYLRRSTEFAGKVCLTPVQLAVVERKRDVVAALLLNTTQQHIFDNVTTKMLIVEKPSKKFLSETRRMFSVPNISVSTISAAMSNVASGRSSEIDWSETWEWNSLHLAVKYDVECLKVLLYILETQIDSEKLEDILSMRDSRGNSLLHLAARNQLSSTPLKLLLDSGAKVDMENRMLVTPLRMAVKFGVVDSAKELLEHGADRDRLSVDICGRGILHYAHNPQMLRFLLTRGYTPDLCSLKYQTSNYGPENVKVLLEDSISLESDLLIMDFNLAMDNSGDLNTDGEYVFLRNFLSLRSLLHVPLVESLLQMKWFACRRVIIIDLLIYTCFIVCLTGVICLSTGQGDAEESRISSAESAMVDLFLDSYRDELERRGWRFIPRSTSHLDTLKYSIHDNSTEGGDDAVLTVIELSEDSSEYSKFLGFYIFTVILSIIFFLREFLELVAEGPRKFLSSVESIFEIFIIFLTVLCQIFLQFYSDHVFFYEILQVMTVFFGWLGLTFQLAKLPTVGIFIYLAIKVFRQLVLSLMVFTTILLSFAFSFHLAMRKHHVFDNAFTSFLKMINMMVGEYEFDENFTFEKVRSVGGSNGIVQFLLVGFTLLVGVTIANLIVALVIANMKRLMEEADAHQLSKTVELLSKVHNVKRALIRIFPCLNQVFAPTLHDYIGKQTSLCVKIDQADQKLTCLTKLQNVFQTSDTFYPVYTYDPLYRREIELTDLTLPGRIVSLARENCKVKEREREFIRFQGNTEDYTSDWRLTMDVTMANSSTTS